MAEELQLKYNGNDPTHGFTLQLILLPALKVACDEMRRTRCNRRLQGRGNGVPDVRAEAFMRPPERHRPLPPGTVEEWAERYVQSGSGQLSTEAAASHAVDKLTHFYEGATSRASQLPSLTLTRRRLVRQARRSTSCRLGVRTA